VVTHLPAAIVKMAAEMELEECKFSELHRRRDLNLDLESGHTAYRCASLIDLCVHTKFHWNRKNFFLGAL